MRFALLATAAFALIAFAGCTGPATTTTTTSTTSAPTPEAPAVLMDLKAMAPVLLGNGVGEPSIAAGPNHTLYVADPFMTIWRSQDDGKTWHQMASKGMQGGGDGDLSVDADGTIHWLGLGGSDAPIPYQHSTDGGASFGKATDLSDGKGFDREWIDVGADGSVYTTWRDNRGLVFRGSHDLGATWEPAVKIMADTLGGAVVHDPGSDAIYVPYVTNAVGVAVSHDFGKTWQAQDLAGSLGSSATGAGTNLFPVVTVDEAGTAYLLYSADMGGMADVGGSATHYGVFLSVSADHGATWGKPALLNDPAKSAIMPWAVAGKAGRLAVTWYEGELGTPSDQAPDEWDVRLWESVDAASATPHAKSALLNTDKVHIGLLCGGGRCTAGSDRSALDFFEVTLNGAGQPVATWVSSLPFNYPASVLVGGKVAVQIYAGGLESGTPLR